MNTEDVTPELGSEIEFDKNSLKKEVTLDDLGEVDDNPQLTEDQMLKFRKFVNGKLNHILKQENKLAKRHNRNKVVKNSRKKNRKK